MSTIYKNGAIIRGEKREIVEITLKGEKSKMGKKRGSSWSWKKAVGITSTKRKIAKITGVPTTKSGRKRKRRNFFRRLFGLK